MVVFWLTLASSASWFVSTLAGGGSPMLLIPVIATFLGASAVPPILTIGMLLGNSQRVYLYWQDIDWKVMRWYTPGAVVGGVLGAFLFTQIQVEWLLILIGLFLILSTLSYKEPQQSFLVRVWYFLPAGFIYAVLSGLVGSTGPLLNPIYLNYGLTKEKLIATKSANVVLVHIAKIITYSMFGALHSSSIIYGTIIGIAALPGNWIGQLVLKQISDRAFRHTLVAFVGFSGIYILWEQRHLLGWW